MLDKIQDWLDSQTGQIVIIVAFLVLFAWLMHYMIYDLRPMIMDGQYYEGAK